MNALNQQRLHADLAEIADHATPVDLRDRVLRGSHRMAVRRAVLATAAIVAVVGVGGVAVASAWQPGHTPPPIGSTTSPSVAPSPSPSISPSTAPSPSQPAGITLPGGTAHLSLGPWTSTPASSFPGTLSYTTATSVNVLAGGTRRSAPIRGPLDSYDMALRSFSFSPDGRYVAWVEASLITGTGTGPLVVADLGTGTRTVVGGQVEASAPAWLPDSRRLVVTLSDHGVGTVDPTDRTFVPGNPLWHDDMVWSMDGAFMAYRDNDTAIVARADGTVVYRVPVPDQTPTGGFTVQSVSTDGRYVGVGARPSDPTPVRGAWVLIDMTTGKEVKLPVPASAGSVRDILPLADGGLLIRTVTTSGTQTVRLYDPSGKQTASLTLASGALDIAYRP